MSEPNYQDLDRALTQDIITPTPFLHPLGPQRGRNFLILTAEERNEIIRRVQEWLGGSR